MRSLVESIIKSNGANLSSRLKDLLTAPVNDRNLKKLIEFWHKLDLDISKYEWRCISDIGYEYSIKTKSGDYRNDYSIKDIAVFDNGKILLTIILHKITNHNIDLDSSKYVEKLVKLFNMNRQEDMDYIFLSFK